MSQEIPRIPRITPRDIFTSSATLIGLIFTAFSVLFTLSPETMDSNLIRNFALIVIGAVLLFLGSVVLTSLTHFSRRTGIWSCAIAVFTIGWAYIGTVLVLLMLGYAFGIQILQFQLPQFSTEVVNLVATIMAFFTSLLSIYYYRRTSLKQREEIRKLMVNLDVKKGDRKKINANVKHLLEMERNDHQMALVRLRIDIERKIRRIAEEKGIMLDKPVVYILRELERKKVLKRKLAASINFVYKLCSQAVHGVEVDRNTARTALDLGAAILLSLERL